MLIQVMSDLHREFYNKGWVPQVNPKADYLVLAGDTHVIPSKNAEFLNTLADEFDGQIICIPGNHEYYRHTYPDILVEYRNEIVKQRNYKRINFLNKQYLIPNDSDIAFLCGTLWTDYDKEREMVAPQLGMNDYYHIRKACEPVTTHDFLKEHKETVAMFCNSMDGVLSEKKVVVVTHHAPSYESVPEAFKGDKLNGAYVSSLEWMIGRYEPAVWIHGHTHNFFDYELGPTRVVCNPVGYPHEKDYKENYTIKV